MHNTASKRFTVGPERTDEQLPELKDTLKSHTGCIVVIPQDFLVFVYVDNTISAVIDSPSSRL